MREVQKGALARRLRRQPTEAEVRLWRYLRNKQLHGVKFRRQEAIGPYVADFACHGRKLIVEVDGGQHDAERAYDEARTGYFESAGWRVVRFWNNDVLANTEGVLQMIGAALGEGQFP